MKLIIRWKDDAEIHKLQNVQNVRDNHKCFNICKRRPLYSREQSSGCFWKIIESGWALNGNVRGHLSRLRRFRLRLMDHPACARKAVDLFMIHPWTRTRPVGFSPNDQRSELLSSMGDVVCLFDEICHSSISVRTIEYVGSHYCTDWKHVATDSYSF